MKFQYKKYSKEIIKPIIPVELKHGTRSIPAEVLIDSGADICLFDAELADALGIDLHSGTLKAVQGATSINPRPYYSHKIVLNVGGWDVKTEVGFMPDFVPIYGLAGQLGFFNFFVVKFDYQKRLIDLKLK